MARVRSRKGSRDGAGNRVRIIGGEHRGRLLTFPDLPGLRPSGDRVRETLFNWLQPLLPGSRCLDLFAGSGVLGLEAASRGAGRVVLIDRADAVVAQLRDHCRALRLAQVEVVQADALAWLAQGPAEPFDILFVDPPFADGLQQASCERLARYGWLAPGARVYLESAVEQPLPALPTGWRQLREKRAGKVHFHLFSV